MEIHNRYCFGFSTGSYPNQVFKTLTIFDFYLHRKKEEPNLIMGSSFDTEAVLCGGRQTEKTILLDRFNLTSLL